ncbi:MAG: AAA family ATPase [Candidatus Desulfatibia sp.]|uniref:AAA family ATPase n=1 Tax=Candidatus Desulfatibia sp. TaxID=3101189 RepID=UPI002F2C0121
MYNHFFGFKERPFKLVPNPAYLFLSKSHQEAMAHLVYAVSAGDGFVELTGEVGTGKTTLCRAFLEHLDGNAEVAFIFNPVLDPQEFIRAINAEFGIPSAGNTTKELMDALNNFLIEKKAQGKDVLLLIDEAQNLTRDVLEQVRLISNLETTQSKLLQIVLVGQPELATFLGSHDLRQLSQRITLSCRLQPLTYKETEDYIKHRLSIASGKQITMFSREAVRRVYRYSRGIPRLINIACDRALLTAYGHDQKNISSKIAAIAVKELGGRDRDKHFDLDISKKTMAAIACVLFAALLITLYAFGIIGGSKRIENQNVQSIKVKEASQQAVFHQAAQPANRVETESDRQPVLGLENVEQAEKKMLELSSGNLEHGADTEIGLKDFLKIESHRAVRGEAFKAAMDLWDVNADATLYLEDTADDFSFFLLAAKQNGFAVYRVESDLELVLKLNLPAILQFHTTASTIPAYLVLFKNEGEKLSLKNTRDNDVIISSPHELRTHWSGIAYIPWKNYFALTGTIPGDATGESIITLKLLLKEIGFSDIELSPEYDEETRKAITKFQAAYDLPVDGVVGPMTKIALYNQKRSLKLPHLGGHKN